MKKILLFVFMYSLVSLAQISEGLQLQEDKAKAQHEQELKELDSMREADPVTTEYMLTPGKVEMIVELDPSNYGFRQDNFRQTIGSDFDLLFRGRAMVRYDYRFFEYFSLCFHAGVDWSQVSLYEKFRQHTGRPAPKQLSVLAGFSGKWRLSDWYMRSAAFLEPSLLVGHMWQQLLDQKSTHWRIKPGIFFGVDSVLDSGLAMQFKFGVEFPVDFAKANAVKDVAEPLLIFGLGLVL